MSGQSKVSFAQRGTDKMRSTDQPKLYNTRLKSQNGKDTSDAACGKSASSKATSKKRKRAGDDVLTPNCKKAKSSSASSSSSSSPVALEVDSARPATHWEALEPILKLNKIPRDAPLPRYKRPLNDPALCDSVADLIFEQCYDQQEKYSAKPYMTIQSDLNYKMRGILVDWIIDVHLSMKLLPPTLWLTVNIMDRYLSKTPIMRKVLQLVGIAALSLACKTEEIYAPGPQDFVYITDNAYSTTELMGMELNVLEVLGWQLAVPTSYHFLLRYLDAVHATTETRLLAHFYAERNLQESDVLQHRPNIYAASAVYAALTQRLSIGAPTSSDITIDERQKNATPRNAPGPRRSEQLLRPRHLVQRLREWGRCK
mmetsp:Transcript_4173/g.9350  ORF Transcript_4173/g.9350 Transcript_4173/m.9350 type:complete len:370 (+) Transcript_4173:195-1304(+)